MSDIIIKKKYMLVKEKKPRAHIPLETEMDTNNMKSTRPMPAPCIGDPTPPTFYLLALGVGVRGNDNVSVRVRGNANFSVFRYQHVGIPNAKLWRWGSKPK